MKRGQSAFEGNVFTEFVHTDNTDGFDYLLNMEQESRRPETTTYLCTNCGGTAPSQLPYFLYFVHYRVSQCSKNIVFFTSTEAENRSSTSTCITVVQTNKGTMEQKKHYRRSRTAAGRHERRCGIERHRMGGDVRDRGGTLQDYQEQNMKAAGA
ncbi:uncharacterized protein CEXT_326001 [Caerostris extrusa]|uniref:Uncharacterized protein n=1 Tax=Caerostris extrusa TaxID=172846 RepID=A0AAV4S9D9_CAEEX|nr:uncharacterized protein CEXT_326001 [Caerostris extrusa]